MKEDLRNLIHLLYKYVIDEGRMKKVEEKVGL
jgi:hypothetical protein